MSVYVEYPTIAGALAAFGAGKCRRHVRVDGHVRDLVQEQGNLARPVTPLPSCPMCGRAKP